MIEISSQSNGHESGIESMDEKRILGIDAGSISISIAELDQKGAIFRTAYAFHNGDIPETLRQILEECDLSKLSGTAVTSSTPAGISHARSYDTLVSFIAAARALQRNVKTLLIVGGERFGAVTFDRNGDYANYRSNSSCAAGTGSFLDQQAKRLNLKSIEEFCAIALKNRGQIPKIASRCAVFAKTDLIHAQQEGYGLEAICDGLSHGLAKNIIDTLFSSEKPESPVIFAGGVSRNRAVANHISDLLGVTVEADEYSHVYGAIGAALNFIADAKKDSVTPIPELNSVDDLLTFEASEKSYEYNPLQLIRSNYPEFDSLQSYDFNSRQFTDMPAVEVDLYSELSAGGEYPVFLGIDIGSTSTKALLLNDCREVMAGFYTRTSGRPVVAVQIIFEAIEQMALEAGVALKFKGAGTTGSGRKFAGEIIGADLALDEITAHARAAVELDRDVDTIIEIGGQDSKFTTLANGRVTFSIMNHVCAAGTGSFIEEQAKKLGCPLSDYSERAEKVRSPMSSDKCTVFMERDLNYYLREGYTVNEALASVLHAVRDNYLTKVAIENNIGDKIFFQGATAKNRALVAAFEQKLGKPIMVSKFCHLTGALGVALHLLEEQNQTTTFRGIGLYRQKIPVETEVCEICTNHCKIKTATINGETVAFGFLCGRDYETKAYVKDNASGFDLLRTRKKVFRFTPSAAGDEEITVGIPSALHLKEETSFWQKFFDLLSIRTVSSETCRSALKVGRKLTGAEFCAPVTALHGHAHYLADKADYIFLPDFLEEKQSGKSGRRHFCYYTQYAPSLITQLKEFGKGDRILNPVLKSIRGILHTKLQLYRMLKVITRKPVSFFRVSSAYDRAVAYHESCIMELQSVFERETSTDINVVLLGRPYSVLAPDMNCKIPEIISRQGVKVFYQDMLPLKQEDVEEIRPLLDYIHWNYAARIFEAAESIANRDGLYPVLVTSFKCTPDAYVIDTFKRILDSRKKPYLILQLDEHDSSVGYETRIEAGLRSFRNHFSTESSERPGKYIYQNPVFLSGAESLKGKTLLLPDFDTMPCKLVEASLRRDGIDARLIEETPYSIRRSMSLNVGQCLPITAMAQAAIDTIEKENLDPANSVIWTIDSNISCNLGVIPHFIRHILDSYGNGFEKTGVYMGEITYLDISFRTTYNAYFAFMFGGLLKKMGCITRPYEVIKGETDRVISESMEIFYDTFLNDRDKEDAVRAVISRFQSIETKKENRPKVAIFGDLYARDNHVLNQDLIRTIEENGGEAITTPYSEYMQMIANPFIQKWMREGLYSNAATARVLITTFPFLEKKYYALFNRVIQEPPHRFVTDMEKVLSLYNVKPFHTGESLETILKIHTFIQNYPDIALFVQTSPSLCCPSLVTEAMAARIEDVTGIPVVAIEYDGTSGSKNDVIIPYLKFPRKRKALLDKQA